MPDVAAISLQVLVLPLRSRAHGTQVFCSPSLILCDLPLHALLNAAHLVLLVSSMW
jgi:hypothetical protein